jgi:hypothetical protein
MNDLRYKINRQAIDRKWEDGQERDLLAEIECQGNNLFDLHIKTDEKIAALKEEVNGVTKAHDFERRQRKYEEDQKLEAYAENAALREKVKKAIAIGHNDDCMFCGFKDKILGGTE